MIRPLQLCMAFVCCLLSVVSTAQNAATSNPTSFTTSSSNPRTDWANPNLAIVKDNQMTSVVLTSANSRSQTLNVHNFSFQSTNSALPNYIAPNATINGIVVSVTSKKSLDGDVATQSIQLMKNGTVTSNNNAFNRRSNWTNTVTTTDHGSPIDTWGTTWSASDLLNPNFGVTILAESKTNEDVKAEIDNISVTVYYNLKVYHSKSTGDIETLSTWGDHHTGSGGGTAPTNFLAPGQVFVIANRSSAALKKNFALTGANTYLVVGNGSTTTLTIPTLFSLNANVMVADNAILDIQNATTPNILSAGFNSTVIYNSALNQNVSPVNYYNLTLTGLGVKTIGAKSIAIENNLLINTGATLKNSGFDVVVGGIKEAIINNGNAYGAGKYVYELYNTDTKIKGTGKFDNLEINARRNSGDNTMGLDANTTILQTIKLSNGIFDNGSKLLMSSNSILKILNGSVKGDLSGSSNFDIWYLMPAAITKTTSNELTSLAIRNIEILGVPGATLVLNRALSLKGYLKIDGAELDASINNFSVSVGGNLTGTGTINPRGNTVSLSGSSKQYIQLSKSPTFYAFTIDNSAGAELQVPVTVSNQLKFSKGILYTTSTNLIIIGANATAKDGLSTSFVEGPIRHVVNTKARKTILFPVGKNNLYKPITLDIAQKNAVTTFYTGEFKLGTPIERALPKDVTGFFNQDRYYTVNCSNNANVDSALITLTYDWYDNIVNSGNLSVVKSNGDNLWKNVKGTKIGEKDEKLFSLTKKVGTIISAPFYSFSDFRYGQSGVNPNGVDEPTGGTADQRTLPLKWVSFTATAQSNATLLKWETAEEVATNGFVIERSADAANWKEIANVKSNNKEYNNYAVTDASPLTVNYYRIKQIDLDGKFTYSRTIQVKFTGTVKSNIVISPNPVVGSNFNCTLNDKELLAGKMITVTILNASGRVVYNNTVAPQQVIQLSSSHLKPGYYIITIGNGAKRLSANFIKK